MSKHWKRTLSLLTVAAVVGLVSAGLALGKKPPPEPDPPEVTVRYSITFLGTLDGDATSVTRDLNNFGEVVGYSRSADGVNRAFVWNDSDGMVALNDLMSDEDKSRWHLSSGKSINDAGQIAVTGLHNGATRAFRFTPGYTDDNGNEVPPLVENLGTLGGDVSYPNAINDLGEVAGYSNDANGAGRGFVWTAEGGMIDIGDLYGGTTSPSSINNSGQVTGFSYKMFDTFVLTRAFRYTPGDGMSDLGDLESYYYASSFGSDINDNGDVVGSSHSVKYRGVVADHAFLYTDQKGMVDLGTLGGSWSTARGVNFSGEIVGESTESRQDSTTHPFLYTNKTDTGEFVMVNLEDLIINPPDGLEGPIFTRKINDHGEICGYEGAGLGYMHHEAVLLTPVGP